MYAADVKQSRAYAKALHKAGILTANEAAEMDRGLQLVLEEWDTGKVGGPAHQRLANRRLFSQFDIKADDEDIFTANERRLSEIVGSDIGGKLHTGRSRNDQTTTDCRLYLVKYRSWTQANGIAGARCICQDVPPRPYHSDDRPC